MAFDPPRLDKARYETKATLLSWQAQSKPGSQQHIVATVELGRRRDRTHRRWFWVGVTVVAMALFLGMMALLRDLS